MTQDQYLMILGTVYIASVTGRLWNAFIGSIFVIAAVVKGMGWL